MSTWIGSSEWRLTYAAGTTSWLALFWIQVSQPSDGGVRNTCINLGLLLGRCPPLFKPLGAVCSSCFSMIIQYNKGEMESLTARSYTKYGSIPTARSTTVLAEEESRRNPKLLTRLRHCLTGLPGSGGSNDATSRVRNLVGF